MIDQSLPLFDILLENFRLLLVAAFYFMAIYNVLTILREEINHTAAITWIFINLSFPFLGVPLYFFLGQSKLKSYSRRRKRFERYFRPPPHLINQGRCLDEVRTKNTIDILDTGDKAFGEMLDQIESAKKYILVQYYIFRPDKLGLEFKKKLIAKAKQGISIYFIYDNLGSIGLTGQYTRDLKRHGVHVARFLPFHFRFNLQINFRNHRKLIVVDGDYAFLGGMNVGEEYLGRRKFWRDTQLMIQGPAIKQLCYTFLEDWNFAATFREGRALKKLVTQSELHEPAHGYETQVFSFGPGDEKDVAVYLYMNLIQQAKDRIIIATPYFIPDLILERCLELAIIKGVKITLLVPEKSDHWYIKIVNQYFLRRMANLGARIYLYQKGFMHQKVLLIDDDATLMGTSNFDNRSIYLNFETSLLINSKIFAQKIFEMLRNDFKSAKQLDLKPDPLWYRFTSKVLRLLSPLF